MQIHTEALPEQTFSKTMLYGPTGAGKTTAGATMPGPRAVIALDPNSSLPLRVSYQQVPRTYMPPGETGRVPAVYIEVESYAECLQAADYLIQHQHKLGLRSVIVDSASTVFDAVVQDVLQERQQSYADKNKALDNLDQQGWGIAASRYSTFMHKIHSINAHILWLCHAKPAVTQEKNGSTHIIEPATFDLAGSTKRRLPAHLGAVLYLERTEAGDKSIVRLRTRATPAFYAKDNTNTLEASEPPDMMVILARMGYLLPDEASKVLAAVPVKTEAQRKAERLGAID